LKYSSKKKRNEIDILLVVVNGCSFRYTKFVSVCLLSSTRSIVFHSLDRGFRNCAVSMDTCNACFRFRARIIVIYNSRTKGPTTRPSGADQFVSTSRRFANLLEINYDYLFETFDIRWSVRERLEASRDFTIFWSWNGLRVEVSINYEVPVGAIVLTGHNDLVPDGHQCFV